MGGAAEVLVLGMHQAQQCIQLSLTQHMITSPSCSINCATQFMHRLAQGGSALAPMQQLVTVQCIGDFSKAPQLQGCFFLTTFMQQLFTVQLFSIACC